MTTRKRKPKIASIEQLEEEYNILMPTLDRLRSGLVEQIEKVISDNSLSLAFPIESRVKSWLSISEKIRRKSLSLCSVKELPDLIGVRVVFLFIRDLSTASSTVRKTFSIENEEDVTDRLGNSEFGYQSLHYGITIPNTWATVPTFSGCAGIIAEIQLRTIAQHTWAAASHLLQYKQESGIPFEVRRSIHRVSALLETVDLEFERALIERDEYLDESSPDRSGDELLNVDLLSGALTNLLPIANRLENEDYNTILSRLNKFNINTLQQLTY